MVRRLFLTPPSLPDETECRSLNIPSSRQWLGIFNQALLQLANQYNYEQVNETDMLPEDVAAFCYDAYQDWLISSCETPANVPTPYWDEDSEVDDSLPADLQAWYGTVSDPEAPPAELDFVENAAIFAFTGFLAVATWEIGAAPAILFHTIAPKFVLAMRRGDAGEIIRILVDGEEAARLDTSSAAVGDVLNVPIVADPSILTGHDITLVQVS